MYFEEIGDRKNHTIIMIHGAGLTQSFIRQYSLADSYHLVLPHLYGNGEEASIQYDPDKCVEGILEIVKTLNKDKITIVGFSLGAQLIIPILCKAEQYFDGAILVSPWIRRSETAMISVEKSMKQMASLMKTKWMVSIQAHLVGMNKEQKKIFMEYCQNISEENLINMAKQGVNIEDYNEYRDLTIPILALAGSKENEEVCESVELLEKLNPEYCKAQIIDKHAHDIPFNKSGIFNTLLINFIENKE